MFIKKSFWLVMAYAIGGSGCSVSMPPNGFTGKPMADQILETSKAAVKHCQYLGIVENSSILGSAYGQAGLDDAKEVAIHRAGTLGATHIVWIDAMQNGNVSVVGAALNDTVLVNGAAYFCEKKSPNIVVEAEPGATDFNYTAAQLEKEVPLTFIIDKQRVAEEVQSMPEKLSGSAAYNSFPQADFSAENSKQFTPNQSIDIDFNDTSSPFE